jgi:hypothetical protein
VVAVGVVVGVVVAVGVAVGVVVAVVVAVEGRPEMSPAEVSALRERFDRLDSFIAEDRLVRHAWGDGQERACLLLTLAPEVGATGVVCEPEEEP